MQAFIVYLSWAVGIFIIIFILICIYKNCLSRKKVSSQNKGKKFALD